jgi:3-hydroxybutyryl-CoA dehydrogenase
MSDPSGPLGRAAQSPPGTSETVFVVGAGIMGSGIAAQSALAGYRVLLEDVTEELAAKGLARTRAALDGALAHGAIAPEAHAAALRALTPVVGLAEVGRAHLVIEAAPEVLALKRTLFGEIDRAAGPGAILATNTSSLPVGAIAAAVADPGRLVGIHFFNPVLRMPLVELIPAARTRPEVVAGARAFAERLGKTVVQSKDTPGFVTSRALAVSLNEAAWMLSEGIATAADIDTAFRLGFHHPMGPLELADLVGLDTTVAILDVLYDGFHDPKYRACPLLRAMVADGRLGRKSGHGFYDYPPGGGAPRPPTP